MDGGGSKAGMAPEGGEEGNFFSHLWQCLQGPMPAGGML